MCFHPNKLGETFVDLSVLKDPSFFNLPPPPPPPLISHLHILRSMVLDLMACSRWSKVFSGRSCYPVMVITQVKFPLTRFAFGRFTFYLDKFCKFWINFPWPIFPWPLFPWPFFPWPIFPNTKIYNFRPYVSIGLNQLCINYTSCSFTFINCSLIVCDENDMYFNVYIFFRKKRLKNNRFASLIGINLQSA